MKKGIIVLLISVLVAGFAFAGTLTGSAAIKFDVDLDAKTFGFVNATEWKYSFTFEFDTTKVEVADHSTELWAEIAAQGTAYLKANKVTAASDALHGKYEVKITKANIHVGEWTFGILNAGTAVNYAASYYKDDNGDPINDSVYGPSKVVPGFTVAYKGWKGGFGLKGSWGDEKFNINVFAHGETKEFKFGANEEFAVQAGGYVHYYTGPTLIGGYPKNAGGAVKFAYKAEKLSADAAADLQIYREESVNYFIYEAAANASYTINDNGSVGANLYATEGDLVSSSYEAKQLKLDAKVWAKYNFDFDGVKLATEGYVDARDILIEDREVEITAKETLTILDGKLALEFGESYFIFAKTLTLKAKATYTADKFVAWGGVDAFTLRFGLIGAGDPAVTALQLSCGIKSTKIIENAEIGLTYKGLDLAKNGDTITKKGVIEAYAKIAF